MSSSEHYRKLEQMYLAAPINREVYKEVTISVDDGTAEITHRAEEAFFHAAQSLHGSVYFKLLDDAAFFAASSLVEDEFIFTVTFQIQLLRPVTTGILRSKGWVEKSGQSILIAQSFLFDERGKRVGIGQGQFMKSGQLLEETKGYKI